MVRQQDRDMKTDISRVGWVKWTSLIQAFAGPIISQRFHSLQTNPVDKHCPSTRVPPRVRPNAKPNIICFGRSGGGTGNAKPFFRINGQPGVVAGGAGALTTISFVDLTKVEATDNVDFFSFTDTRTSVKQFSPFEGQMYEMIIYNGFTGPASNVNDLAEKTEGYLAHKYGKQNEVLSALHPYRVNPPLIDNTVLVSNNVTQVNGNIGVNPGADGDERVVRIDKAVSGPDAPKICFESGFNNRVCFKSSCITPRLHESANHNWNDKFIF